MDIVEVAMAGRMDELELQCFSTDLTSTEQSLSENCRQRSTTDKNLGEQCHVWRPHLGDWTHVMFSWDQAILFSVLGSQRSWCTGFLWCIFARTGFLVSWMLNRVLCTSTQGHSLWDHFLFWSLSHSKCMQWLEQDNGTLLKSHHLYWQHEHHKHLQLSLMSIQVQSLATSLHRHYDQQWLPHLGTTCSWWLKCHSKCNLWCRIQQGTPSCSCFKFSTFQPPHLYALGATKKWSFLISAHGNLIRSHGHGSTWSKNMWSHWAGRQSMSVLGTTIVQLSTLISLLFKCTICLWKQLLIFSVSIQCTCATTSNWNLLTLIYQASVNNSSLIFLKSMKSENLAWFIEHLRVVNNWGEHPPTASEPWPLGISMPYVQHISQIQHMMTYFSACNSA